MKDKINSVFRSIWKITFKGKPLTVLWTYTAKELKFFDVFKNIKKFWNSRSSERYSFRTSDMNLEWMKIKNPEVSIVPLNTTRSLALITNSIHQLWGRLLYRMFENKQVDKWVVINWIFSWDKSNSWVLLDWLIRSFSKLEEVSEIKDIQKRMDMIDELFPDCLLWEFSKLKKSDNIEYNKFQDYIKESFQNKYEGTTLTFLIAEMFNRTNDWKNRCFKILDLEKIYDPKKESHHYRIVAKIHTPPEINSWQHQFNTLTGSEYKTNADISSIKELNFWYVTHSLWDANNKSSWTSETWDPVYHYWLSLWYCNFIRTISTITQSKIQPSVVNKIIDRKVIDDSFEPSLSWISSKWTRSSYIEYAISMLPNFAYLLAKENKWWHFDLWYLTALSFIYVLLENDSESQIKRISKQQHIVSMIKYIKKADWKLKINNMGTIVDAYSIYPNLKEYIEQWKFSKLVK